LKDQKTQKMDHKIFSLQVFILLAIINRAILQDIHENDVYAGSDDTDIDENGYILYCPCMGRFGNQADHFLGALGFAKGLNRTLVLPPWIEYLPGRRKPALPSFSDFFKVDSVSKYHRVILMENFMGRLSDKVWPVGKRTAFCYSSRHGPEKDSCNAKDGSPFGPFWSAFDVEFDASERYSPLNYDIYHGTAIADWARKYPPSEWPVIAFTGAPASFPVQTDNVRLHKYLEWSDEYAKKGKSWVNMHFKGPYVGIHLRNGVDWSKACEHISSSPNLFSAAQCLGYRNEFGKATNEMCFPGKDLILKHVRRAVKEVKAKAVYVASDNDHMVEFLSKAFKKAGVKIYKQLDYADPHLDLVILAKSNHFIGNCISSFSAFVKRERDVDGLPSSFWGFPPPKPSPSHQEL